MKYVDLRNQKPELQIKKRNKGFSFFKAFLLGFILLVFVFCALYFTGRSRALFDPVSIVSTVAASNLKETDGRINILIMGMDKRNTGTVQSILTDTLVVASLGKLEGDVVLISLPRDLWVKSTKSGYQKINALYYYGGAEDTKQAVESVLGIPLHYYVVVDFNIFKETINILDGIDIEVKTAFEDYYYPIEGRENDTCGKSQEEIDKAGPVCPVEVCPCRYEHLKFESGIQKMDGDIALKYARSRHGNNGEGTDFARAKRQQQVILAVKSKALSLKTLTSPAKLKDLYDTYAKNVDTNIGLAEAQSFFTLSQQVDFSNVRSIVLDDRSSAEVGGLLYAPTDNSLYGGQYVLIPKAGDFSQIHAYVKKYLFGQN